MYEYQEEWLKIFGDKKVTIYKGRYPNGKKSDMFWMMVWEKMKELMDKNG